MTLAIGSLGIFLSLVLAIALAIFLPVSALLKAPLLIVIPIALARLSLPGSVEITQKQSSLRQLIPIALYLALFSLPPIIPKSLLAVPSTHVLLAIDAWLVGAPFNTYFDSADSVSTVKDVLAWLVYGVWHYISPVVACVFSVLWCWRRHRAVLDLHFHKITMFVSSDHFSSKPSDHVLTLNEDNGFHLPNVLSSARLNIYQNDRVNLDDSTISTTLTKPIDSNDNIVSTLPEGGGSSSLANVIDIHKQSTIGSMTIEPQNNLKITEPTELLFTQFSHIITPTSMLRMRFDLCIAVAKLFLVSFGITNSIGVVIQLMFPTAPPWYIAKYGLDAIPSYSTIGDPAGLARVDELFSNHIYRDMFSHSPLVFGSFPSLHSAFATTIAFFFIELYPRIHTPFIKLRLFHYVLIAPIKILKSTRRVVETASSVMRNRFRRYSFLPLPQRCIAVMNPTTLYTSFTVKDDEISSPIVIFRNDLTNSYSLQACRKLSIDPTVQHLSNQRTTLTAADRTNEHSQSSLRWQQSANSTTFLLASDPEIDSSQLCNTIIPLNDLLNPNVNVISSTMNSTTCDSTEHFTIYALPSALLGVAYVYLVWWSTLYFTHHFFIDLLAGSILSGVGHLIVFKHLRRVIAFYNDACIQMENNNQSKELSRILPLSTPQPIVLTVDPVLNV